MSAEYSLEEVRARLAKLHDFINGKCANDEAGWKCVGFIFQHGEQLLNILAERIKADESAVPVAQLRLRLDRWDVVGIHGAIEKLHLPAGEYPLFVHPPAQAAQVEESPMFAISRSMHSYYTRDPEEARQAAFDGAQVREIITGAPTAEPVAQGEVAAEVYAGAFGTHYIACADPNKLPVGTKLCAAQPRAVPDGAWPKMELWFFRDLTSAQRLALFALHSLPVDEIGESHVNQKRMLRHLLTATPLPAAQPRAVPDGWVLVPVNPTPAMDSAGQDAVDAWLTAAVDTGEAADGKSPAAWTYKAMLAAAPSPGASKVCNRNCDCVGPCKMGGESA